MITEQKTQVEVAFQHREGDKILCDTCPQRCALGDGDLGKCGGRQVIEGRFYAINYGQVCTLQLDPIEKKPLYHFYPGSEILSVGPNGCNLSCEWCLNWQVTQKPAPTRVIMPSDLADIVDAVDGIGAAYTFAEPLIWFEFIRDAGQILHDRDLLNIFITNGYINAEPLREILPIADAFNVDLKSHDDACYRNLCGGCLEDVQRTIRMIWDAGKSLEITHLLVTGVNDNLRSVEQIVDWVAGLDQSIPLHLTRFFGTERYNSPSTGIEFMTEAYELARSKLDWVYLGNLWTGQGQNSVCPKCGEILIERNGYDVQIKGLDGSRCRKCGRDLNFVADPL